MSLAFVNETRYGAAIKDTKGPVTALAHRLRGNLWAPVTFLAVTLAALSGSSQPVSGSLSAENPFTISNLTTTGGGWLTATATLLTPVAARAAAITEDCPPRAMNVNLLGGQSFVVAVVPFHQIRIDLGTRAEPRQFAGLPRPSQRARQHQLEISRDQFLPQQPRLLATVLSQRDVRHAGVLTAETPFRVSVSD